MSLAALASHGARSAGEIAFHWALASLVISVIFASGFSLRSLSRLALRKKIHAVDGCFGWFGSFTRLPLGASGAFCALGDWAARESTTSRVTAGACFGLRPRFLGGSSFFRSPSLTFPFLPVPVTSSAENPCSAAKARALLLAKLSLATDAGADASDSLSETDVTDARTGAARRTSRRTGALVPRTSITSVRFRLNAWHTFAQSDIVKLTTLILVEFFGSFGVV